MTQRKRDPRAALVAQRPPADAVSYMPPPGRLSLIIKLVGTDNDRLTRPGERGLWCYTDRLSYLPGDEVRFHTSTSASRYSIEIARVGARRDLVYDTERHPGRPPSDAARGVRPRLRVAGRLRLPDPEGLAVGLLRGDAAGGGRKGRAPRVGSLLRRAGACPEACGEDPDGPVHQHLCRLQLVGRQVPLRERRPLGGVPAVVPAAVAARPAAPGAEHHSQHQHGDTRLRRASARRRVPTPRPAGLPPLDAVRGLPHVGVDLRAVDGSQRLRAGLLRAGRPGPRPRGSGRVPHADDGRARRVLDVAGARCGGRLRRCRRARGVLHRQRRVLAGAAGERRPGDGLLQVRAGVRPRLWHRAGEVPDRHVVEPAHGAAREPDLWPVLHPRRLPPSGLRHAALLWRLHGVPSRPLGVRRHPARVRRRLRRPGPDRRLRVRWARLRDAAWPAVPDRPRRRAA